MKYLCVLDETEVEKNTSMVKFSEYGLKKTKEDKVGRKSSYSSRPAPTWVEYHLKPCSFKIKLKTIQDWEKLISTFAEVRIVEDRIYLRPIKRGEYDR